MREKQSNKLRSHDEMKRYSSLFSNKVLKQFRRNLSIYKICNMKLKRTKSITSTNTFS